LWFLIGIGVSVAFIAKAQLNNQPPTTFPKNELFADNTIHENTAYSLIFPDTIDFPDKSVPAYKKDVKRTGTVQNNYCSCVLHVKVLTGFAEKVGQAKNWPSNTSEAHIGGVVITRESSAGHVAKIIDIQDGYLILDEANWIKCSRTVGRRLRIDSKLILGYWKP